MRCGGAGELRLGRGGADSRRGEGAWRQNGDMRRYRATDYRAGRLPRPPYPAAVDVRRRLVPHSPATTGALGLVQRLVGLREHRGEAVGVVAGAGGADRDADAQAGLLARERGGDRIEHGRGRLVAAARAARDPDGELVAPEPADDALAGQRARDLGEDQVAGCVAVAVVDGLEVVDVADEDAARLAVGDGPAHGCHPVPAVEDAGQVVDPGLTLELGHLRRHRRAALAAADGLERQVVEVLVAEAELL